MDNSKNKSSSSHVTFAGYYFPDQRVSRTKKEDKNWFIPTYDYIIQLGESLNDKNETLANLEAAKGNISEETKKSINSIIKKLGIDPNKNPDTTSTLVSYIRDIDIITPIKERYLGEFEKSYHNYFCTVTDENTLFEIDKKVEEHFHDILANKFAEVLNTLLQGQDPQKPTDIDTKKLEEEVNTFKNRLLDTEGEKAKHLLDYISKLEDIAEKFTQAFYYWFATEEVYSHRYVDEQDEKVKYEIVPPYEYYRIPSRNRYVEDDAMGFRRYKLSLNDIKKKFGDRITEQEYEYLKNFTNGGLSNPSVVQSINTRILSDDVLKKYYGDYFASGDRVVSTNPNDIEINHVVWETETKIGILTYMDYDGTLKTEIVDPSYVPDLEAGDVDLEIRYVPEMYEGWRIGRLGSGVYIKPEPANSMLGYNGEYYNLKNPYNGMIGLFKDNGIKPIPRRIEGYSYLYRLYSHLELLEISKFKNFVSVIPESLLLDSDNFTISERLDRMYQDSLLIVKDHEVPSIGTVSQLLKSIGSPEQAHFIEFLNTVKGRLKQEAWEAANMNPERFGDIDTRGRVSNTDQAIIRVSTGSIPMHVAFDRFRERDYQYLIDTAKIVYNDGIDTSFTNTQGKYIRLNIKPNELTFKQIGVFVKKDPNEEEKKKRFQDMISFAAAQNGEFEIAAEAIDSDNPKELKRFIYEFKDKLRSREKEMEAQKAQIEKYVQDAKLQDTQMKNEAKINEITTEQQLITDREIYLKELDMYIQTLSLQSNDEYANDDSLAQSSLYLKQSLEERKLSLKTRDQDIKLQQIKSQEKIAKMNKN